jgi:hypothetical protein
METRRIRRRERRRTYRIAGLATSVAVACVALGMWLPRNRTASVLLFAAAGCCLVVLVLLDDARAPLHGIRQVVRLPLRRSLSATFESFWSRLTGTLRASVLRRMEPTPIVLDEADDEAAAWWGPTATTAHAEPEVPVPSPPASEPAPPRLAPVLAAPMATAHVPAEPVSPVVRVKRIVTTAKERFTERFHRRERVTNEVSPST